MNIYTNRHVGAEKVLTILDELLQSQRASTEAEFIYLGHYKESQWEHKVNFISLFSFFSLLFCCLKEEYEHKSTFLCVLSSNHHHHFIFIFIPSISVGLMHFTQIKKQAIFLFRAIIGSSPSCHLILFKEMLFSFTLRCLSLLLPMS